MTWLFSKKRWLILILALLVMHALAVFMPMLNQSFQSRTVADDDSLVIQQRQHAFSEAEAKKFSRLFGIKPVSFELVAEVEEPEAEPESALDLLNAKNPRLLAVDEVSNVLTARVLINDNERSLMKSIKLGESLHGYELAEITMHQATFVLVEQEQSYEVPEQIHLKIFSRDN